MFLQDYKNTEKKLFIEFKTSLVGLSDVINITDVGPQNAIIFGAMQTNTAQVRHFFNRTQRLVSRSRAKLALPVLNKCFCKTWNKNIMFGSFFRFCFCLSWRRGWGFWFARNKNLTYAIWKRRPMHPQMSSFCLCQLRCFSIICCASTSVAGETKPSLASKSVSHCVAQFHFPSVP